MSNKQVITRTVWVLSLVSLFTDFAGEMLYPVMPVYLKSIGYTIFIIGLLEGIAEAIAGFGKIFFGRISDLNGRRLFFVQLGYALSAIAKPMLAVNTKLWWVFSSRFLDRLGKGMRSAPRDALLNDEATPKTRGTIFGLHRSMDTVGAILGPIAALIFLHYFPGDYELLFVAAFFPGLLAILLTFIISERPHVPEEQSPFTLSNLLSFWGKSPTLYRRLIPALVFFALFNSSDVFLLLKIKEAGFSDTQVISAYIFYNIVFSVFAFPIGRLADRLGLKNVFIAGLLFFIITYSGFALNTWMPAFWIFFFTYGLFAACTEGIAKAWIAGLVPKHETASALGLFAGLNSFAALIASSMAGFLWMKGGSTWVFLLAAASAALSLIWVMLQPKQADPEPPVHTL